MTTLTTTYSSTSEQCAGLLLIGAQGAGLRVLISTSEHLTRTAGACHAPERGIVAVSPPAVSSQRVASVLERTLVKLGHTGRRRTLGLSKRSARLPISVHPITIEATPLLRAHALTDLVIPHGEWLSSADIAQLVTLTRTLPARVWIAVEAADKDDAARWGERAHQQQLPVETRDLHKAIDAERAAARQSDTRCPSPACNPGPEPDHLHGYPHVPSDSALTFLDTCARVLAPADIALVEQTHQAAAREARRALGPHLVVGERPKIPGEWATITPRGNASFLLALVAQLRSHFDAAGSDDELLTRLRGVQAALLTCGAWLDIDCEQVLSRYASMPRAGSRSPRDWAALSAVRGDTTPAAVVAALAHGIPRAHIPRVLFGDVAPDASYITYRDTQYGIAQHARFYLLAHLHARHLAGARDNDLLFQHDEGGPLIPGDVSRHAARPRELGIHLLGTPRRWAEHSEREWLRKTGFTVQLLRRSR